MEVPLIFLNRILLEVAKSGASSLHLSAGSAPMVRINGKLEFLEKEDILTAEFLEKIISSLLKKEELEKLAEEKEIVLVKEFAENFRFRVSIFYQKNLPAFSFNYISNKIKSWQELNLPGKIKELIGYNSGLLIIAGPNDSGKTTTIATIIEEINQSEKKYIITLENPVEYIFLPKKSVIEQRQIGLDVKSYEAGLNHCLKEDVDVVYLDEIKKKFEFIIPLVLELAAGNSLVILEINSENSIRAIEKILSAGGSKMSSEALRYNLADTLLGVISQRLIPGRSGGLVLASEILILNSPTKSLIREGKIYQLESIIQTSREEGMISMKKAVEGLIDSGKIRKEEAEKLKLI